MNNGKNHFKRKSYFDFTRIHFHVKNWNPDLQINKDIEKILDKHIKFC